ncbi:TPA: GatB/YqeY domain-containing protein [Candidatus Saccharibacteria bacterium]|nr:GatB/YqeY domain-containing protein [Candidatus Saccharibacteria bacterium]HIO87196.1 GatB/YqeY domain-containing protein [Candidatus Saccharibacteria bacterium]
MQARVLEDLKQAMLSRDAVTTSVLKQLKVAFQYAAIDKQSDLDEAEELKIIKKEAKKRREAIEIYEKANHIDKAESERKELAVLETYLPQQLSEAEMLKEVEAAVEKLNATQLSDVGKVMGHLSQKLAGNVDNRRLSEIVRDRLKGDS